MVWRRCHPQSDVYSEDCGLIVVSDTEVGMFWNFSDC